MLGIFFGTDLDPDPRFLRILIRIRKFCGSDPDPELAKICGSGSETLLVTTKIACSFFGFEKGSKKE